jgi:hypothetical protein
MAVAIRAAGLRVADRVHAAVDAGALAVPHGEDTIVARAGVQAELLRTPDGGGRQVLVDPWAHHDVVGVEQRTHLLELAVDARQRRTAVSRDEAGGVEAPRDVALALHQR